VQILVERKPGRSCVLFQSLVEVIYSLSEGFDETPVIIIVSHEMVKEIPL
jgi:hypothetical protein